MTPGIKLRIEYWPLSRLKQYERNPRKNDDQVDKMVASITEYGFTVPILARSATGLICDGHLRYKAAVKMGMTEVPVIPCDGWTEAQFKAFRLLSNRSVAWAAWDTDALSLEMGELKLEGFDLSLTGFDSREIDKFTAVVNPAEDEVPPLPATPVTRLGDLWELGDPDICPHCGEGN